ncbi:DUF2786 domain-containing protein [Sphingobium lignivorans]|uniref:DUF7168 domain-containing protein n=1 Tax=Sphingobium lignivorans TaxID=2735886 RepID=A0ABR6NFE7_9SPHN|nr:DUF2786 domain-containing protein [Sphingobium lignivorans]MBB5986014.1 hypothetical protein [Sphingobium lignivorans]
MTEREKIAARIRALRAKTVENGCTEDEAIAAAEMLAKLLAKHNMTIDEAEMRASPFEQHSQSHEDRVGERLWKIAATVSELTGTRYWTSRPGVYPIEITFFGFAHEVEVARYMLEICAGAMRREHARLEREAWPRILRRSKLLPFLDGMADRLALRIRDLIPPKPVGTGLMVLHDELGAAASPKTEPLRARGSRNLETGYLDGLAAADRVALNKGLTGGARQAEALIG